MENIILDYTKDLELFNKTAEKCADEIRYAKPTTTPTQIRNFYDYVLKLYEKVYSKQEAFANVLPFIKMLNSKVNYANARGVVNDKFVKMISACVKEVKNEKQLETFKLFFEAVIGFSKKSDRGERQ